MKEVGYCFTPRFKLNIISKDAPLEIKNIYKLIISKYINIFEEKNIDSEDWIESIVPLIELHRLDLLHKTVIYNGKSNVELNQEYIYLGDEKTINNLNIYCLGVINVLNIENLVFKNNISFPLINNNDIVKVENYYLLNTFKKYALRWFDIASFYIKEYDSILTDKLILDYFKKESVFKKIEDRSILLRNNKKEKVFIKTVKKWLSFAIEIEKNDKKIYSKFINELGYDFERLTVKKDNLIIQEYVNMRYEYRMIIVNNELVCGAGCIEKFTPLNNEGEAFDIKLQEIRNISDIEKSKELVDRYILKTKSILKYMKDNNEELKHFTIDLALNEKNEIVLIELNPYVNIGFYALKYDCIIKSFI